MKNAVVICCDDNYVAKSIVAIKQFIFFNKDFKEIIIGKKFSEKSRNLCSDYNVELFEVDLSNDFINLENRKYGKDYPIECFYHFYAYKILNDYDYIIKLEPDIITNKKLEIDFDKILYISGSYHKDYKINKFTPIINDLKKINKIYKKYDINQYRILGGAIVYNVKGLVKINFYEKIIEYYKNSIKLEAQRMGDDSLMLLYQILNKEHIYLLEPEFHVIFHDEQLTENFLNNVTFLHFYTKYWKVNDLSSLRKISRYYYNIIIEFIYNNFSLDFIKEFIPEIFVDISNVNIPFYYYNEINNFGDLITPYYLQKFCKKEDYSFNFDNNTPKLISCGSIMRLCQNNVLVYGSGIRDIKQQINKGIIQIVRGPLTRKRLLEINCYCPPVFGDPGLLLPIYYKPDIKKKYKLGIIPHYIHFNEIKQLYNNETDILVINLLCDNIENVIDDILSCEKTVSSSLHGIIISDTYNIPNKWIKFDNKIKGDDTKFYDYFLSVKRNDNNFIDCMNYKKLPDNIIDLIPEVKINFDINKLKERMFFDENGIKNYTKYLYKKYIIDKNI